MTWPKTRLGDVSEIVSGSTPKTGVPEYWDGDIPWVTPADLSKLESHFIADTPRKLTSSGLRNSGARMLPIGSVLFSSRAPIGHVAITSVPMSTNQGFKSFVPEAGRVDSKYLFWWLRANKTYLQSLGVGATFKEVSKSIVSDVRLPLPPIAEQRRIAAILDRTDELRAKRRRGLAVLAELADAIFVEAFEASAIWPSEPLVRLLSLPLRNGVSPSTRGTVDAEVLTLSAITRGRFDPSVAKFAKFDRAHAASKTVRAGELLICRGNGNRDLVGRGELATVSLPNVAFPDTIIAARLDDRVVDGAYIQAVWNRPLVRRQIEAGARTTNGTFKVNQEVLEAIQIPIPPIGLQRAYAKKLSSLGQVIAQHHEHLAKLNELFASLQRRAFSGEL